MKLDFSEKNRQGEPATYKEQAEELIAASKQNCIYTKDRKPEDAFMLLIKGLGYDELDNLCDILNRCYAYPQDECYAITQGTDEIDDFYRPFRREAVYRSALRCMEDKKTIGNKRNGPENKFVTTAWISHSLCVAKLSKELAAASGLDPQIAEVLGLLHDIGRQETHAFDHTVRGFEILIDEGWKNEAPITLTHSFLDGKGATLFNTRKDGPVVIDLENMTDSEQSIYQNIGATAIGYKHDLAHFVEEYKYSPYDEIVNVADLMTLITTIESPYERVQRLIQGETTTPDHNYRLEFLSDFINTLNKFLVRFGIRKEVTEEEKANPNQGMTELMETFKKVSDEFYGYYCENIQDKGLEGEGR